MSLKYSLFIILCVAYFKVKAQTLLNADLVQIKKEVYSQKGGAEKAVVRKKGETGSYYQKVTFFYPTPMEGNPCIFRTTFYLTSKNKCLKYVNEYWGDELPIQKINELTKFYPDLKKINNLKWIDNKNRTEINLIQDKQISAAYSLEIKSF